MEPEDCYIYVQGWKADAEFVERAQGSVDGVPHREAVIVDDAADWPDSLPALSDEECAIVICGCDDHPSLPVACSANNYRIRKTFLDVEAEC
jgi:hypothetical protein